MEARVLLSTYVVNTFVDQTDPPNSTTISLRDAIALAAAHQGPDTIDVPAGDYKLTQGGFFIDDTSGAVTIQGIGGLATLDVQSESPYVFNVNYGAVVNLISLDITGAAGNNGSLDLGAITNLGALTVTNCSVSGNAAGALVSVQSVGPAASATLSDVTISDNGQGIYSATNLNLVSSTISDNQSDGIDSSGNVSLFDSTIASNSGIGVKASAGQVTIGNSVIAGNFVAGDVSGVVVSKGGNVIGDAGASTGWAASDLLGNSASPLDPLLGPLGNYGGLTQTMPPLKNSDALASGLVSEIPAGVVTDQRGLPRVVGGAVDSGAVETQRPAVIQLSAAAAQQIAGSGVVNLGSFAAPGLSGPFVVHVNWGDGAPNTDFSIGSAGAIPAQFHRFAIPGLRKISVAVSDGAGNLSNLATLQVKVVAAPPSGIVVNTANDQTDAISSKTVSLRDAIARANQSQGPVTITFDPTVFATAKTIQLIGAGLSIGGNPFGVTTIAGPTAGVAIELGDTASSGEIDGGNVASLDVARGFAAVLHGLIVTGDTADRDSDSITNEGTLTITNSTLTNLESGLTNSGSLTLTDSTVSGCEYSGIGNSGMAVINDCTVTENSYGVRNTGQAVISDSTITDNIQQYSDYGPGISNAATSKVTLSNSVVADNTLGTDTGPTGDITGAITSLGHNLIGEKDGSTGWIASDLTGTIAHPLNPKLAPLGNYGGPTLTQFPLSGSPALNAGSVALIPSGVTTDQRGFHRVVDGKVDIGAFQTESTTTITITPPAPQSAVAGVAKNVSLGSFSDPGAPGPFIVKVAWGDGSPDTVFSVKTAGSLATIDHTFTDVGNLTATIYVLDAAGDVKSSTFAVKSALEAPQTIVVNTNLDVNDPAGSTTVSLRDAIDRADAAFGPVDITFSPTVFATAQTIQLSQEITALQDNHFGKIDFIGPAAGITVKSHTTYPGTNGHGELLPAGNTFVIDSGITASFSNFILLQLGFVNSGSLTLVDSTITGNMVVGNGAGLDNQGTATVLDSTISNNYAEDSEGPGGDFAGYGGGIENDGTLTLTNSTISGNSATRQGGGIDNYGLAVISDSTISENQTFYAIGDGINNAAPNGSSQPKVTLANTIVAGNTFVPVNDFPGSDVNGAITSSGHNLIGKKDGSTGWTGADFTGTIAHPLTANLSPPGNFGGPTQTMLPLSGSPALGAGSVSLIPSGVTTDQRGLPRVVNGKVDIGAVEIQKETPFSGSPAPFGRIQAENFDLGGPGAGYYNPTNINRGGLYRPTEGVGIGAIPTADGGGYFVGWTLPGEYLNYTATVAATGTYTLDFRVASQPKGGTFHFDVDGKNVTGELSIPSTGDWNVYTIVSKTGVKLTAGTHVLQLVIDSHGTGTGAAGNFDWFEAVKTS